MVSNITMVSSLVVITTLLSIVLAQSTTVKPRWKYAIEKFCLDTMNQTQTVTNECREKPNSVSVPPNVDPAILGYICCLGAYCKDSYGQNRDDVNVYLAFADTSLMTKMARSTTTDIIIPIAKVLKCLSKMNNLSPTEECAAFYLPGRRSLNRATAANWRSFESECKALGLL